MWQGETPEAGAHAYTHRSQIAYLSMHWFPKHCQGSPETPSTAKGAPEQQHTIQED